ncbi:MAG: toll/interleukin-1 receptor domain-containing protein [Saprospiraceae bacterium]
MISKDELYYQFLDYVIKNHKPKIGIDPLKVLQELGFDEYEPHAYAIAKALKDRNFVETMPIHDGKVVITEFTIEAKYFVNEYKKQNHNMSPKSEQNESSLDIFISHSSKDIEVVEQFIELLIKAFKIDESKIRCTSVPRFKLPSGSNVDNTIKNEISASKAFIGFITEKSLDSVYVLFELGARWGSERNFRLMTADQAIFELVKPPLVNHHIICISNRTEIYQILDEIQQDLSCKHYNPINIEKEIVKLLETISNKNKHEIAQTLIGQTQNSEFSQIELDILKSADGQNGGIIRIISSKDGATIQCGTKVILDSNSNKEIQQYKSAIESLLEKEFLTAINNNGNRYKFTNKTYEYLNRV